MLTPACPAQPPGHQTCPPPAQSSTLRHGSARLCERMRPGSPGIRHQCEGMHAHGMPAQTPQAAYAQACEAVSSGAQHLKADDVGPQECELSDDGGAPVLPVQVGGGHVRIQVAAVVLGLRCARRRYARVGWRGFVAGCQAARRHRRVRAHVFVGEDIVARQPEAPGGLGLLLLLLRRAARGSRGRSSNRKPLSAPLMHSLPSGAMQSKATEAAAGAVRSLAAAAAARTGCGAGAERHARSLKNSGASAPADSRWSELRACLAGAMACARPGCPAAAEANCCARCIGVLSSLALMSGMAWPPADGPDSAGAACGPHVRRHAAASASHCQLHASSAARPARPAKKSQKTQPQRVSAQGSADTQQQQAARVPQTARPQTRSDEETRSDEVERAG